MCEAVESSNGRALVKNGGKRVNGRRAEACGGRGFGRGTNPPLLTVPRRNSSWGLARTCGAELPTRGVDGPRPLLGLHCGAAITTCFERHWLSVERSSVRATWQACGRPESRRGKFSFGGPRGEKTYVLPAK